MITRDDESNFPEFSSHDDAVSHIQSNFGSLIYEYKDTINGKKISFYDHFGQSVQIWDDGNLHICY